MEHDRATTEEPLCILIEGAARNDASFYGRWLSAAADANEILDEALDSDERQEIVCKLGYEIDLGNTAIYVMEKLLRQGGATCINADEIASEQLIAEQMAIMTDSGFYTRWRNPTLDRCRVESGRRQPTGHLPSGPQHREGTIPHRRPMLGVVAVWTQ